MYFKAPTHADRAEKISCIFRHLPILTVPKDFVYFKAPTHADCREDFVYFKAPTHADCREDFVYFKAPTHADCAEKISCILRHLPMLTVPRRFRVF